MQIINDGAVIEAANGSVGIIGVVTRTMPYVFTSGSIETGIF
jgi:hypothetical protein